GCCRRSGSSGPARGWGAPRTAVGGAGLPGGAPSTWSPPEYALRRSLHGGLELRVGNPPQVGDMLGGGHDVRRLVRLSPDRLRRKVWRVRLDHEEVRRDVAGRGLEVGGLRIGDVS